MKGIHGCYGTGTLHYIGSVLGDPSFDGAKKTLGRPGHPKSQKGENNQLDARWRLLVAGLSSKRDGESSKTMSSSNH